MVKLMNLDINQLAEEFLFMIYKPLYSICSDLIMKNLLMTSKEDHLDLLMLKVKLFEKYWHNFF